MTQDPGLQPGAPPPPQQPQPGAVDRPLWDAWGTAAPGDPSQAEWGPAYVQQPARVTGGFFSSGRRAIAAVGVAAVLLVAAVAGVAAVSSPSSSPSSPSGGSVVTADASPAPSASAGAGLSSLCQTYLDDLASRLHVSVDVLEQAVIGAAGDTLDQAVKDGKITSDMANLIKGRLSTIQGSPCAQLPNAGPGRGFLGAPSIGKATRAIDVDAILDAAATALHTDRATLLQELGALKQGENLKTIAQKHNVDYGTLTSAIHDAVKTQLDAAVKAGTITADQETNILTQLDARLANGSLGFGVGRGEFFFRGGMPGMMRGPGGMFRGPNGAAPPAPSGAPTT